MVPFHDFPRNPPKSMKNKGKLSKTNVFPLFSLILTKNHEMPPSSDRKKINHPSSKKTTFLPNTWNTLKTSFLKCLRVCNFFFSQRCWCSQHLKKYHFWILCENSEHLTAQLQISTQMSPSPGRCSRVPGEIRDAFGSRRISCVFGAATSS